MSPLPKLDGGAPLASAAPGTSALRIAPPLSAAAPPMAPLRRKDIRVSPATASAASRIAPSESTVSRLI